MIGNDTILGFFEAIVNDKKFQQLKTNFYNGYGDPWYFRNVKQDREKGEVRYNSVEPNTGALEVHDEVTVEKLSEHIDRSLSTNCENTIEQIDEFVDDPSNNGVETFIRLQLSKIGRIQDDLDESEVAKYAPVVNDYIFKIKAHLTDIAEIYDISVSENDYGIHQQNRGWIIQTFNEEIAEGHSQNQSAKNVVRKYQEEFGLNISKTTVLRYNGRVD